MSSDSPSSQSVKLFLAVSYPRARDVRADHLPDLGDGGLAVRTDLPLPEGTELSILLKFEEVVEPLTVSGVVRGRTASDQDATEESHALAVELVFGSEKQRERFQAMVDPGRSASPSPPPPAVFRVLIVEENEHILDLFVYAARRFHAERLSDRDLDILCATSGEEALELAAVRRPDMAITDVRIADMSGERLVESIRSMLPMQETPIIVIGSGGGSDEQRYLERGANAFLGKPVQNRKLMAVMSDLLGLS